MSTYSYICIFKSIHIYAHADNILICANETLMFRPVSAHTFQCVQVLVFIGEFERDPLGKLNKMWKAHRETK